MLLARWGLKAGHHEALQRQIAERHLSAWYAASVSGAQAWAVLPLGSVLTEAAAPAPSFLALRRAIDMRFGGDGAKLVYSRDDAGSWTVAIESPATLSRIAELSAAIAGLEILSLRRLGNGGWDLEGRPVAPEALPESRFNELTGEIEDVS